MEEVEKASLLGAIGLPHYVTADGYVIHQDGKVTAPYANGQVRIQIGPGKWKFYNASKIFCQAWHGVPPMGLQHVLHKDGNKHNYHKDNLIWSAIRGNMQTSRRFKESTYDQIEWLYLQGLSNNEIARRLGVSAQFVGMQVRILAEHYEDNPKDKE